MLKEQCTFKQVSPRMGHLYHGIDRDNVAGRQGVMSFKVMLLKITLLRSLERCEILLRKAFLYLRHVTTHTANKEGREMTLASSRNIRVPDKGGGEEGGVDRGASF